MSAGRRATLPEEMEQHLLRIAQEAVTNVLKHAGASQIWIKLHSEARKLVSADRGQRPRLRAARTYFRRIGRPFRADRHARARRAAGRRTAPGQPSGRRNGSGSDGAIAMRR